MSGEMTTTATSPRKRSRARPTEPGGITPPPITGPNPHGLKPSEVQALRLLVRKGTWLGAAMAIGVSDNAIHCRLYRARRRYHAATTLQLLYCATLDGTLRL